MFTLQQCLRSKLNLIMELKNTTFLLITESAIGYQRDFYVGSKFVRDEFSEHWNKFGGDSFSLLTEKGSRITCVKLPKK